MNSSTKPKRLVLHFDLNQTVIMRDKSKDLHSVELTICYILVKIAWGKLVTKKVAPDKEEIQWQLVYDQLSTERPPKPQEEPDELISYREYLDKFYPLKKKNEIPDDGERNKANAENENIRMNKMINFAVPGNPGAKFKQILEKMKKNLSLPKSAKEELGIRDELAGQILSQKGESQTEIGDKNDKSQNNDERKETTQMSQPALNEDDEGASEKKPAVQKEEDKSNSDYKYKMDMFGEGKYHLIPSFFRLLIFLKKAKREFAITFRTFGEDLANVIYEFNLFCTGEHPCYNGRGGTPLVKFDGNKGTKDLSFRDRAQKAVYYRYSDELGNCRLVTGTLKRTSHEDNLDEFYSGDIEEGSVTVIRDPIDQYVQIIETLKKKSTMAIQEDYLPYQKSNYKSDCGKLLLIDQADYGTQQIFFDDNADEEDRCIVDVRDVVTQETIQYKKFINKYVVKVEPHRAILEPEYFIKLIEQAENQRDLEIDRIEQGLDSEDEKRQDQKQEDSEWSKLQALPNEEYLMRTILPVLYQGMRVVDLERPVSPLEYLALYLLKHQDQIKLPPKPQQQQQ